MCFYRPQWSRGQVNIFAPVCHSVHSGACLPQCMLGYHPPPRNSPHQEQTPPRSRLPLGADPLEQTPPPGADTPPGADPPRIRHPPPPPRSRLWHTVNERPVRILLECILVEIYFFLICFYFVPDIKHKMRFLFPGRMWGKWASSYENKVIPVQWWCLWTINWNHSVPLNVKIPLWANLQYVILGIP